MADALARRLGLADAVWLGLGAMIGAGVFVAWAPAATAAGSLLLVSLGLAGLVAGLNALSSARLAARYPMSGGAYFYGTRRLGPFWGYLAGWAFVAGKTGSGAAMAYAVGLYAWPEHATLVAGLAVLAATGMGLVGVQGNPRTTRYLVIAVLAVLAVVVVAIVMTPDLSGVEGAGIETSPRGVLAGAAYLFFAFAGYARLSTLGTQLLDPARTIPRAMASGLVITVVVYGIVGSVLVSARSADVVAANPDALASAAQASPWPALEYVVRAVAAVTAFAALLGLLAWVSRTVLAMARDRHLPRVLRQVDARSTIPQAAELTVGLVVLAAVILGGLASAIAFSSACVLTYYAIANASAWTLSRRPGPRLAAAGGIVGCLVLALALPWATVLSASSLFTVVALLYAVQHTGAPRARR